MKFTKKAFTHSCKYGKYLSFATLVTPITVLVAEQFAFHVFPAVMESTGGYGSSFLEVLWVIAGRLASFKFMERAVAFSNLIGDFAARLGRLCAVTLLRRRSV